MTTPDYTSLVQGQRTYFKAGKTRPVSWRVEQLKAIKAMIEASRGGIRDALRHDLRRNETGHRPHGYRHQHPRSRVRAREPSRLANAAARGHADGARTRPRACAPRPARGDDDHRRVERALHAYARPARVGAGRGELRGDQDVRSPASRVLAGLSPSSSTGRPSPWSRARSGVQRRCSTRAGTLCSSPEARRSGRSCPGPRRI